MLAAPKVEPALSELMSWEEIKQRYPDQWVFCVDFQFAEPDNEDCCEYRWMRVAAAGQSRAEAVEGGRYVRGLYPGAGCRFTGPIRSPFGIVALMGPP